MKDGMGILGGITVQHGAVMRFGGQGVFVAILMGFLTTEIYRFCITKNLTIEIPQGVPEGVLQGVYMHQFLGPQVRFIEPKMKELVKDRIPVQIMNMQAYNMMNGEKILDDALALIGGVANYG